MCKTVIDVSRHQGKMDWSRAANAGVVAGVVRATMGIPSAGYTGVDEQFARNYQAMLGEGILRGAYHLFFPEISDSLQAEHFLSTVEDCPDFFAVVDVELNNKSTPKALFWDRLLAFCTRINNVWPNKLLIYTANWFWASNVGTALWPLGGLWVAHYTSGPKPTIPKSWGDWKLWQFSADGNRRGAEFGAESWDIDISRANFRL